MLCNGSFPVCNEFNDFTIGIEVVDEVMGRVRRVIIAVADRPEDITDQTLHAKLDFPAPEPACGNVDYPSVSLLVMLGIFHNTV